MVRPAARRGVFTVFASAVGYPLHQRLIILAVATGPAALLLLMALRTGTVLDADGVHLYQPIGGRFVAWDTIEAVAIRPIGWARAPMIALRVAGNDIAVPAPVPGIFRQRYANEAIAELLAFIYPPTGPVDESTPLPEDVYEIARSAVDGEHHVERFTARGRRGVVLRLGMLYGPGTDSDTPAEQDRAYGATLAIADAGQAITAALQAPAGIYNVVADGQRVSNARFKQATDWTPT